MFLANFFSNWFAIYDLCNPPSIRSQQTFLRCCVTFFIIAKAKIYFSLFLFYRSIGCQKQVLQNVKIIRNEVNIKIHRHPYFDSSKLISFWLRKPVEYISRKKQSTATISPSPATTEKKTKNQIILTEIWKRVMRSQCVSHRFLVTDIYSKRKRDDYIEWWWRRRRWYNVCNQQKSHFVLYTYVEESRESLVYQPTI